MERTGPSLANVALMWDISIYIQHSLFERMSTHRRKKMPPATPQSKFSVVPLSKDLRKDSLIGAEIVLDPTTPLFDPSSLSSTNIDVLGQAVYEH